MSNQRPEPLHAGQRQRTDAMIGRTRTAAMGLSPRGISRWRRSMIGVGKQGEEGRLAETSRRRALRLGAAIVLQLEQGKLSFLFGLPRLKLLPVIKLSERAISIRQTGAI